VCAQFAHVTWSDVPVPEHVPTRYLSDPQLTCVAQDSEV